MRWGGVFLLLLLLPLLPIRRLFRPLEGEREGGLFAQRGKGGRGDSGKVVGEKREGVGRSDGPPAIAPPFDVSSDGSGITCRRGCPIQTYARTSIQNVPKYPVQIFL